jgi:hypothetical protein
MSVNNTTVPSVIYYTTDGTEPTTTSFIYNGPFQINENSTLKAIAVSQYGIVSDLVERIYTFKTTSIIASDNNTFQINYIYGGEDINKLVLQFYSFKNVDASFRVFNLMGSELEFIPNKIYYEGTNEVVLSPSNLNAGVYLVVATVNGTNYYKKFAIK